MQCNVCEEQRASFRKLLARSPRLKDYMQVDFYTAGSCRDGQCNGCSESESPYNEEPYAYYVIKLRLPTAHKVNAKRIPVNLFCCRQLHASILSCVCHKNQRI